MRISIIAYACTLFGILLSVNAFGQKNKTAEFEVKGVCDMCRVRIENAALLKGVKYAKWDKESKKVKVYFNSKKTSEKAIHEAIAQKGHDTSKVKAKDEAYAKLPDCCKYRDGVKDH